RAESQRIEHLRRLLGNEHAREKYYCKEGAPIKHASEAKHGTDAVGNYKVLLLWNELAALRLGNMEDIKCALFWLDKILLEILAARCFGFRIKQADMHQQLSNHRGSRLKMPRSS